LYLFHFLKQAISHLKFFLIAIPNLLFLSLFTSSFPLPIPTYSCFLILNKHIGRLFAYNGHHLNHISEIYKKALIYRNYKYFYNGFTLCRCRLYILLEH
jgi:hypothetical protein